MEELAEQDADDAALLVEQWDEQCDELAEAFAEALVAITGDDGSPGFLVSMIPIVGSWI